MVVAPHAAFASGVPARSLGSAFFQLALSSALTTAESLEQSNQQIIRGDQHTNKEQEQVEEGPLLHFIRHGLIQPLFKWLTNLEFKAVFAHSFLASPPIQVDAANKALQTFQMLLNVASRIVRQEAYFRYERLCIPHYRTQVRSMALELECRKANLRIQQVAGHTTELLELVSENPSVHILLIPGNPGCVAFYRDYVESLFNHLDRKASITAICHIAHTSEDWEGGKVFSLQEQIDHKVQFLKGLTEEANVPIMLVGHSVGAHISLKLLREFPDKVDHVFGMYPFLTVNRKSLKQQALFKICLLPPMTAGLSLFAGLLGSLPRWFTIPFVKSTIGRQWGPNALESAYSHLLKYSVICNMTYMGGTEYKQMQIAPDWDFLKRNQRKISLLFGSNDHWGPLSLCNEVSLKVPNMRVIVEKEGLLHDFACNKVGSNLVAQFTTDVVISSIENL